MSVKNPLKVINSPLADPAAPFSTSKKEWAKEVLQAELERCWLVDPEQFDPNRSCMEREHIKLTVEAIESAVAIKDKHIVDLGCGFGAIAKKLRDKGGKVLAVDIAANALKRFSEMNSQEIETKQEALPNTTLEEENYDLVICTDVITFLPQNQYRLLISELARIVKAEGMIVCSTSLDTSTEDPLGCFVDLLTTELIVEKCILSYNRLHCAFSGFFGAPGWYVRNGQNSIEKQKYLPSKNKIGRKLFALKCSNVMKPLWITLDWLFTPFNAVLKNSTSCLKALEAISKAIWDKAAATHVIAVAKRRPLFVTEESSNQLEPIERRGKKQVWE